MEFEPMDAFEEKLKRSFERQPAPPGLRRRLMERRRRTAQRQSTPFFAWRGVAAAIVSLSLCILAALVVYGNYQLREAEKQRQGEAARQQVLLALRITNHALEHMNRQFAANGRAHHE
ncbi:MAG: hypothetical protein ACLQGT_10255 [Terracidiphilus sp.]